MLYEETFSFKLSDLERECINIKKYLFDKIEGEKEDISISSFREKHIDKYKRLKEIKNSVEALQKEYEERQKKMAQVNLTSRQVYFLHSFLSNSKEANEYNKTVWDLMKKLTKAKTFFD